MTLWQRDETAAPVDRAIAAFTIADDVAADRVLFRHDITATIAHARGLARIGVVSASDAAALTGALERLALDFAEGRFVLDERFEDGHTAIEHVLTEALGPVGRRVHAGRSRNDQVQVALRLYMKERLGILAGELAPIAKVFLTRARATVQVVMPGYTHLQRAVPSTVGLWFAAMAEAFVDDLEIARTTTSQIDACPLGTGAGFGVSLPLDRAGVARELGFARIAWNPMAVQNARGKTELLVLGAFEAALLDVRRFAWDLSLYAMPELGFVRLPDRYTTGSSLMPNKRNPDVVELLRAAYAQVAGARVEIASTLSLPSGYHRDLQRTKAAFVRAIESALAALRVFASLASDMEIDAARMASAIDPSMFATDRALELVAQGVPFRDAYRAVKREEVEGATTGVDAGESIRARCSPGACADLRLDEIASRLSALEPGS